MITGEVRTRVFEVVAICPAGHVPLSALPPSPPTGPTELTGPSSPTQMSELATSDTGAHWIAS